MTSNAKKGNSFVLKMATTFNGSTYEQVAALRATSLTINNSTVDVTTKDSVWQCLMPGGGVKSISVSADGIFSAGTGQDRLREAMLATTLWNAQIVDEDANTWTGAFHIESVEYGGDANSEETFSVSMSSAEEIVYA